MKIISGFFYKSKRYLKIGKNKEGYCGGQQTQQQARDHCDEFMSEFPHCDAVVVYDNSSGHDCMPLDALTIAKININPGHNRKHGVNIRQGWYLDAQGKKCSQSMFFKVGDTFHVPINDKHKIDFEKVAKRSYPAGHVVTEKEKELVGVLKGSMNC